MTLLPLNLRFGVEDALQQDGIFRHHTPLLDLQDLDQSALLGEAQMGVLVRMQLLDKSEVAQRPLTDGLPVKVEFEHRWDSPGATQFATQVQHYWDDLRDHLISRRA